MIHSGVTGFARVLMCVCMCVGVSTIEDVASSVVQAQAHSKACLRGG
jgi:hypothetical protein